MALVACSTPSPSTNSVDPSSAPSPNGAPRSGATSDATADGAPTDPRLARFEVAPRTGYQALALTSGGGCALHSNGKVACWGSDVLGVGTEFVPSRELRLVPGLDAVARLAGRAGICASRSNGETWCWGLGSWRETEGTMSYVPTRTPHLDGLVLSLSPALDGRHGCGVAASGELRCWGGNGTGQLGRPEKLGDFGAYLPAATVMPEAKLVATGYRHSCATDARDALYCWGDAEGGALGDGDAHARDCEWYTPKGTPGGPPPALARRCKGPDPYVASPRRVNEGPVSALAAGGRSSCAVIASELRCWGDEFGATPSSIGLADVVEVAGADRIYCARTRAGAVHCWGSEPTGRWLSLAPRPVEPLAGSSAIAVEGLRVCGLVGGAVRCWGRNASGLRIDDVTDVGPE